MLEPRVLCFSIGGLLLAGGCVIGKVDTPLERLVNFPFMGTTCQTPRNDADFWNLYLIDEQTQEPLGNVEIERVDPIPNPDSIWSWIKYGDEDFIYTPLTKTDSQGKARLFKSNTKSLEARFKDCVLQLDFVQRQAKLVPLHLSKQEPRMLKFHEVEPGLFTVKVPVNKPSK